jgi:hypothetical protein
MLAWTAALQIWRVCAGGQRWREFLPAGGQELIACRLGQ